MEAVHPTAKIFSTVWHLTHFHDFVQNILLMLVLQRRKAERMGLRKRKGVLMCMLCLFRHDIIT